VRQETAPKTARPATPEAVRRQIMSDMQLTLAQVITEYFINYFIISSMTHF